MKKKTIIHENYLPVDDGAYLLINKLKPEMLSKYSSPDKLYDDLWKVYGLNRSQLMNAYKLLNDNLIDNINELVDCASISIERYDVVKKLASGGWSDNYLIIKHNNSSKLPVRRFLKIVDKKIHNNSNVERIISSFGGLENTLEKLESEEEYVNDATSNPSEDNFKNFQYRPLPNCYGLSNLTIRGISKKGIIYDFIDGETCDKYLTKELVLFEKLDLLSKVAYSLNYIHQKGFTHNDIKPDNFMVGKNGRVYLLDLAFSRLTESHYTIRGVGTYTAPERIKGGASPTEVADQYSFGVLAYQLLTGELPLTYSDTKGDKKLFSKRVNSGKLLPKNILDIKTDLPKEIGELVMKCLSYNPKDRYKSMQEVEDEFISLRRSLNEF